MIGGTNGIKYEVHYRQIEDLFYENLYEVKLVRDHILDITKSTWLKNVQRFRDSITELENIIKNLINRIFEEVETIEEGIEAIYAFRSFKHKKCLQHTLLIKWIQVRINILYKIYKNENVEIRLIEMCRIIQQICLNLLYY
jgi:hypothetical protein